LKNYSLLRRITVSLTITTLIAGFCTYGWLYLKARSTEISLRGETLLDRARNIAAYIVINKGGELELDCRHAWPTCTSTQRAHFAMPYATKTGN
jgi:hypothetical protein